jgi:transposase
MNSFAWSGFGRPPSKRPNIFKAFIAKSVYNYPTTKVLIENLMSSPRLRRLCGWEHSGQIPSESTFSRVFKVFSKAELTQEIHEYSRAFQHVPIIDHNKRKKRI